MDRTGYRKFGQALRALRKSRGYGLKQVVQASTSVGAPGTSDPSWWITYTYITQLESGGPFNPVLAKLMSLSCIYGVTPEHLIGLAPEPLRSRRLAELKSWRDSGRIIPEAFFRLPDVDAAVDAELDRLFAARSRDVSLPLRTQETARNQARHALQNAILVPHLERAPALADRFWHDCVARIALVHGTLPGRDLPGWPRWERIADLFVDWAVYEQRLAPQAFERVAWWHCDFPLRRVSCHFLDQRDEGWYGFDALPTNVLHQLRWRQLACLLASGRPNWPIRLSPLEVVRDYVAHLLEVSIRRGATETGPAHDAKLIVGAASRLARDVPELADQAPGLGLDYPAFVSALRHALQWQKAHAAGSLARQRKPHRSR